jgi:hypothetical protein
MQRKPPNNTAIFEDVFQIAKFSKDLRHLVPSACCGHLTQCPNFQERPTHFHQDEEIATHSATKIGNVRDGHNFFLMNLDDN